jgi:hypothetical protein
MCATHSPRHSTVMAFVRATTLRHRTLLALLACVIALHSGQLAFAQQGGFLLYEVQRRRLHRVFQRE